MRPGVRGASWGAAMALLVSVAAGPAGAQSVDDFFRGDVVHEIRLNINSRDWQQLKANFDENTYYPCHLRWNGLVAWGAGVRSRGQGSRSPVKPGLRIDFDRYETGQRFLGLRSLVLDNLTQDASTMHERLTMEVFARMGLPASREAFARVWINERYAGLYAVIEPIDKEFLARHFGESDGYLFEYEWRFSYDFRYLGPQLNTYLQMFKPKTHELEAAEATVGPIEEMIRLINEAGDDEVESIASRFLNLDDLARHLAIEALVADPDGIIGAWGMNNFYLYRPPGGVLSRFLAWDKDIAFLDGHFPLDFGIDANVLSRRAMAIPRVWQIYCDTLRAGADVLEAPTDQLGEDGRPLGWFEVMIEQQYQLVRDAVWADTLKPYSNEEFEEAVAHLNRFAHERSVYVRLVLQQWEGR